MSKFYNLMYNFEFEIRFIYPSRCLAERHEELKKLKELKILYCKVL